MKKHIENGCLSDIPPSGGTNRNERLHEHIKNYFNRSRIGILLAYAILHMIIHAHNTSTIIKGKKITCPIEASPVIPDKCMKIKDTPVGIVQKPESKIDKHDHWEADISENIIDLEAVVQVYQNAINKFNTLKKNLYI